MVEHLLHILAKPLERRDGQDALAFPLRLDLLEVLREKGVRQAIPQGVESLDVGNDGFWHLFDSLYEAEFLKKAQLFEHVIIEELEALRAPEFGERTSATKEVVSNPRVKELIDKGIPDYDLAPHELILG